MPNVRAITDRFAAEGYPSLAPALFNAAAPNYGVLPGADLSELTQHCPMVGSYGAKDRMLPGAAARLETALTEGNVRHDVKEYPNVGHSFMNDWGTPSPLRVVERVTDFHYSQPESEDAWRRNLAFFATHLS